MDIVKIGSSKGTDEDFMSLVDSSQKKRCERYVEKCHGPSNIFTNKDKKNALQFLDEAFKGLEQYKDKIGLVIDSSTSRGFAEPSQASLYAQHLGLRYAASFDMTEACNGWVRAIETAFYYFQLKPELEGKYILIINNEHPPETRALVPEDQDDYKACSSYYVGKTFSYVCTCTLLEGSNNRSWRFFNHTDTQYATHISIPLPIVAKDFVPKNDKYDVILNEKYGQFCLPRYHNMEENGFKTLGYIEARRDFFSKSNLICHTFTQKVWEQLFSPNDFKDLSLYYNSSGNLGSCSCPYILRDCYGDTLPEKEHIAFIGTAAGGSGTILTFVHKQDDGDLQQGQKQEEIQPMGKFGVLFYMGLRFLKNKLLCKKKQNNKSKKKQ